MLSGPPQRLAASAASVQRVKVIVRIRPQLPGESKHGSLRISGDHQLCLVSPRNALEELNYGFDRCYGERAGQAVLFGYDVVPLLERVMQGYHGTIFAYGNTGAGKTHTMVGSAQDPGKKLIFDFRDDSADSGLSI